MKKAGSADTKCPDNAAGLARGLPHALCGLVNKQRTQRGQSVQACEGRWMMSGTAMGGSGTVAVPLIARRQTAWCRLSALP